jgi:hypothetical protein
MANIKPHYREVIFPKTKEALIKYLTNLEGLPVTFNFNTKNKWATRFPDSKFARQWVAKIHKEFMVRINREYIGRRWRKRPPDNFISSYSFIENEESNIHLHSIIMGIPQDCLKRFNDEANEIWRKLSRSGTVHISGDNFNLGWVGYINKDVNFMDSIKDNIIVF